MQPCRSKEATTHFARPFGRILLKPLHEGHPFVFVFDEGNAQLHSCPCIDRGLLFPFFISEMMVSKQNDFLNSPFEWDATGDETIDLQHMKCYAGEPLQMSCKNCILCKNSDQAHDHALSLLGGRLSVETEGTCSSSWD
jgi:hypothetical protein